MIHPTAIVEPGARIGANTRIWHYAHIRSGAVIGDNCNLGLGVFVDSGAVIGNDVKLQNRVSVYRGVTLEDGTFVGPHATFTNDKYPRSITPDGSPISEEDWQPLTTLVKYGASIGASATILGGVSIGRWAMVAASALVREDVPDHGMVAGVPARLIGYVCACGHPLQPRDGRWCCQECGAAYELSELKQR